MQCNAMWTTGMDYFPSCVPCNEKYSINSLHWHLRCFHLMCFCTVFLKRSFKKTIITAALTTLTSFLRPFPTWRCDVGKNALGESTVWCIIIYAEIITATTTIPDTPRPCSYAGPRLDSTRKKARKRGVVRARPPTTKSVPALHQDPIKTIKCWGRVGPGAC